MRKLGIEIECILPFEDCRCERDDCSGDIPDSLAEKLRSIGVNFGEDSSINQDNGVGLEVRIGHVTGEDMEKKVREVCAVLNEYGASIDNSCGLHVHADTPELNFMGDMPFYSSSSLSPMKACERANDAYLAHGSAGNGLIDGRDMLLSHSGRIEVEESMAYTLINRHAEKLANDTWGAMRFLSFADSTLRSAIPSTRRHNTYCLPLSKVLRTGGSAPTLKEINQMISTRYCGINFAALQVHGTIENRYHSGTLNANKIIHWARIWASMVDVATTIQDEELDAIGEIVSDRARKNMILAALALPGDTEKWLMSRTKEFSNADSKKVASFIRTKKAETATR